MKHYSVMPGSVEASVALYGVPDCPELAADESMPVRFIGHDVNTPELFAWLDQRGRSNERALRPYIRESYTSVFEAYRSEIPGVAIGRIHLPGLALAVSTPRGSVRTRSRRVTRKCRRGDSRKLI